MQAATRGVLGILGAAVLTVAFGAGAAVAEQGGNGKGNGPDRSGQVQSGKAAQANQKQSGSATDSPQPPSNADFSGNGANNHGPYDSTRDGSASANGNGNGKATGKPCAGCVGKADNKNPPGQLPGGSDTNRGYECDDNSGVGRGNPAHTSCTSDPGTLPPTTPTTPPGPGPESPPQIPPAATPPQAEPPTPASTTSVSSQLGVTDVPAFAPESEPTLARTGFDAQAPALAGLILLGTGSALLAAGRRRQ